MSTVGRMLTDFLEQQYQRTSTPEKGHRLVIQLFESLTAGAGLIFLSGGFKC